MPPESFPPDLSKRERQVVEIIFRMGRATARDVEDALDNAPTYSAVRSILRILVNKGVVKKMTAPDGRDWFAPKTTASRARCDALRAIVRRFFGDSAGEAACALLGEKSLRLSAEEAERLMKLIEEARRK
ncbi:BlaI/MecI/CopY family transcriptional regulator [Geminisphaera colitermitum]|uniref:BlaI/MecI/CopY family transcriptional regulator n=1 Tax=Geminisphaera colitermitum TaxID=1148786 RepID=UPI000158D2BB|nr:BlaI/MecI/CopY family transcriptional regulator [Geminisphaera colitermitum]